MKIGGVLETSLYVSDLARSIAFYRDLPEDACDARKPAHRSARRRPKHGPPALSKRRGRAGCARCPRRHPRTRRAAAPASRLRDRSGRARLMARAIGDGRRGDARRIRLATRRNKSVFRRSRRPCRGACYAGNLADILSASAAPLAGLHERGPKRRATARPIVAKPCARRAGFGSVCSTNRSRRHRRRRVSRRAQGRNW